MWAFPSSAFAQGQALHRVDAAVPQQDVLEEASTRILVHRLPTPQLPTWSLQMSAETVQSVRRVSLRSADMGCLRVAVNLPTMAELLLADSCREANIFKNPRVCMAHEVNLVGVICSTNLLIKGNKKTTTSFAGFVDSFLLEHVP